MNFLRSRERNFCARRAARDVGAVGFLLAGKEAPAHNAKLSANPLIPRFFAMKKAFLPLIPAVFSAFVFAACCDVDENETGAAQTAVETVPVTAVSDVAAGVEISVEALPQIVVDKTVPAQGVAGAFAFVQPDGTVCVAGGALFPEKGPGEGGKKVYVDTIWTLAPGATAWTVSEKKLPVPAAYGVSAGKFAIGGENSTGKLAGIVDLSTAEALPTEFPAKIDNAAAAGEFVAGGNVDAFPTTRAFVFRDGAGTTIAGFHGTPRQQPVAGILKTPRGNAFALVGGFFYSKATNEATIDRAGVIYFPAEKKWESLPALPAEISGAALIGATAVPDGQGGMLIFGGVNAEVFKNALENPAPDYLLHEPSWYKFNPDVLRLSFGDDGHAKWEKLATVPATARAGAAAVRLENGDIIFACGELKPGFRSPDCVRIKVDLKK